MNSQEKAIMYDLIVREGQELNTKKNNLKSTNGGINLSVDTLNEIKTIDERLYELDLKLKNLLK